MMCDLFFCRLLLILNPNALRKAKIVYSSAFLDAIVKVQKLKKLCQQSYIILRIQWLEANSVYPDEEAHYESPHLGLHCLQIQLLKLSVCVI